MKKIKLINQGKGGQGKSFLVSLIVAKETNDNSNFIAIDTDSGNRSLIKRFSSTNYTDKVVEFSLFKDAESETIDKTLFEELFTQISDGDYENIYIDLGGNESRELVKFFELIGIDNIKEYFTEMNLEVEFFTVISAGDRDCIDHLNKVQKILEGKFSNVIFVNEGFLNTRIDTDKIDIILAYAKKNKLDVRMFGKSEGTLKDKISIYVRSGFTTPIGMFKGHFNKLIKEITL